MASAVGINLLAPRRWSHPVVSARGETGDQASKQTLLTRIAQVSCSFVVLRIHQTRQSISPLNQAVPGSPIHHGVVPRRVVIARSCRQDLDKKLTCFAAIGSVGMPQPWRKQLANSKIASTSSPLAAPPFLSPAWRAMFSTTAALDAALERYVTAAAGSGAQPHPCLPYRRDQPRVITSGSRGSRGSRRGHTMP
jgi:hypothetical protein